MFLPDAGAGILGYFLNRYGFGTAPVILGLILGPIAESNLRRGLQAFEGDWAPFFTRPISLTFLVIAIGLLGLTLWQNYRANRVTVPESGERRDDQHRH